MNSAAYQVLWQVDKIFSSTDAETRKPWGCASVSFTFLFTAVLLFT